MGSLNFFIYSLLREKKNISVFVFIFLVLAIFLFYIDYKNDNFSQKTTVLIVEDQKSENNIVYIKKVSLARPGYIVIHKIDGAGEPSKMLGVSKLLKAKTYNNLPIEISSLKEGKHELIAMVHFDNGDGYVDLSAKQKSDQLVILSRFEHVKLK